MKSIEWRTVLRVKTKTVAKAGGDYYARDKVKSKLAHKHKILFLQQLSLQFVVSIKETAQPTIFLDTLR